MVPSILFEASRGAKNPPLILLAQMSISETVAYQQHRSYTVIQLKNICSCCLGQLLLEYSFEQETLKGEQAQTLSPGSISLFLSAVSLQKLL